MFNQAIRSTPFTEDIGNSIFPNILGDSFNGDVSFLATLRALLAPRLKEDEYIRLRIQSRSDRESELRENSVRAVCDAFSCNIENNTILICSLNGTDRSIKESMRILDEGFCENREGFEELKALRLYIAKQADARFYINRDNRSSVIFIGAMRTATYHVVEGLLPLYLPWYFKDANARPDKNEEDLLASLCESRDSEGYRNLIEAFAKKYDFRKYMIQNMLSGFENAARKGELDGLQENLRNTDVEIRNYTENYRSLCVRRSDLITRIQGIELQIKDGGESSEIMNYFMANKNLTPVRVSGSSLKFIVASYLCNFDPDFYATLAENRYSYLYSDYAITNDFFRDPDKRKKLLDAIFADELVRVKICAAYELDTIGCISGIDCYNFPKEFDDYIRNPHIQYHACLGNYRQYIEESLREGNYIGAIEQCCASCMSVNVGEGISLRRLLEEMFSHDAGMCIELPDGTAKTPQQAYEWLIARETTEESEEEA